MDGCGGTPSAFVAAPSPQAIAVKGAHVYWVANDTLFRCLKQAPCTPATVRSLGPFSILAEDATHLYIGEQGASVRRVPK